MRRSMFGKLAVAGAALCALALVAPQAASAAKGNDPGPQAPRKGGVTAAFVPDQCHSLKQLNADEQKYRLANNAPWTYSSSVYGSSWFTLKCGTLQFTVPRGMDSMLDFTAAGELDCQAPNNPSPNNGWCESRFLVNAVNVLPNNTLRGDTFAWDSSNGGSFDWQAHTLNQVGHAFCPPSDTTTSPCVYNVFLQARFNNGATDLWVDDLNVRVDVSPGPVSVTTTTP